MSRQIALLQAYNNPNSVPPLIMTVTRPSGPITRAAASMVGFAINVSGGTGVYSGLVITGYPAGLTPVYGANTITFTGTPTTIGHNVVTASATDSSPQTVTQTFSMDVKSRLSISHYPGPAELSFAYSDSVGVTGNTGALSFTTSTVQGITLGATGALAGTPTGSPGLLSFATTITDAGTGDTLAATVTFWMRPQFSLTAVISTITGTVVADIPAEIDIVVLNPWYPPYKSANVTGLPAWASFQLVNRYSVTDGSAGGSTAYIRITGTPPSGSYTQSSTNVPITAFLTDNLGRTVSLATSFNVTVPPALQPKQAGSVVGSSGPKNLNIVGATVSNDGVTATIDITQSSGYLFAITTAWAVGNVYTATPSPALASYIIGQTFAANFGTSNTGSATLNINGLGAKPVTYLGAALTAGQIPASSSILLNYDGANFDIVGVLPGASFAPTVATITTSVTLTAARWNVVKVNANALTPLLPTGNTDGDRVSFDFAAAVTSFAVNPNGATIETVAGTMTHNMFMANGRLTSFDMVYFGGDWILQ